jgi:hypothetical protein
MDAFGSIFGISTMDLACKLIKDLEEIGINNGNCHESRLADFKQRGDLHFELLTANGTIFVGEVIPNKHGSGVKHKTKSPRYFLVVRDDPEAKELRDFAQQYELSK